MNDRGEWAAPLMATEIVEQLPPIDVIICSTSVRTRMTADALLALAPDLAPQVRYDDMAYHASRDEILAYAESIPENEHHLWIGHDPGLTEAVKALGWCRH